MTKEQLKELLSSLTDDNEMNIIFDIFDDVAALIEDDNLGKLSEPQKNFYLNYVFDAEVHNGGIAQFFGNVPQFAHETVKSLTAIGAKKNAELLQKAISQFRDAVVPTDFDDNLDQLDSIGDEVWDKFDDEFYEYENEEDLNTLNLNYIRENIDNY